MPRPLHVVTMLAVFWGATDLPFARDTHAVVLCQKRNRITLRPVACKKAETAVGIDATTFQGQSLDQVVARALAAGASCPADAVRVGPTCVDKYEASVWSIPAGNTALIEKAQQGTTSAAELIAGGAAQHGCTYSPFLHTGFPGAFPSSGNWTEPLYAVSVPGVVPTACLYWFQAEQACALSGKRLLTNQEWQRAAAGTPDPPDPDDNTTDCETGSEGNAIDPVPAGSRARCVSAWGAFDMVGNVAEWVADWNDSAVRCTDWTTSAGIPGNDVSCFGGPGNYDDAAPSRSMPAGMYRGGGFSSGTGAGVFAVDAHSLPAFQNPNVGFRCAR